jgi:hypothetical protein
MRNEVTNQVSLPETWRGMDDIHARTLPSASGELEVLILADTTDLQRVVQGVWDEVNSFCSSNGIEAPVTVEDLTAYFATAVITRVQHVRRRARDIRVEDHWGLPFPLQSIVNSIGEVRVEVPAVLITPNLAKGSESLGLSRARWLELTRRLLSLETRGLRMAHALEAKRDGVARVMRLTIDGSGDEWIAYSSTDFKPYDALVARAVGLRPTDPAMAVLPNNPLWRPPFYMDGRELVIFEQKFSEIGFTRASA